MELSAKNNGQLCLLNGLFFIGLLFVIPLQITLLNLFFFLLFFAGNAYLIRYFTAKEYAERHEAPFFPLRQIEQLQAVVDLPVQEEFRGYAHFRTSGYKFEVVFLVIKNEPDTIQVVYKPLFVKNQVTKQNELHFKEVIEATFLHNKSSRLKLLLCQKDIKIKRMY